MAGVVVFSAAASQEKDAIYLKLGLFVVTPEGLASSTTTHT